jgi:hypothetical protein
VGVVAPEAGVDQQPKVLGLGAWSGEGSEGPGVAEVPSRSGLDDQLIGRARLEPRCVEEPEESARVGPSAGEIRVTDSKSRRLGERAFEGGLDQDALVAHGREEVHDRAGIPAGISRRRLDLEDGVSVMEDDAGADQ